MTTTTSLFTLNGDGYDITPADMLLILADTVYDNPHEFTPAGRNQANAMNHTMLSAARKTDSRKGVLGVIFDSMRKKD